MNRSRTRSRSRSWQARWRQGTPAFHAPAAKELRISVITTKRAYEELERDGFLENVPGKGCFVAPQNRELLREAQLRRVEEKLTQAIEEARRGAVSLEELKEMLTELYQEV